MTNHLIIILAVVIVIAVLSTTGSIMWSRKNTLPEYSYIQAFDVQVQKPAVKTDNVEFKGLVQKEPLKFVPDAIKTRIYRPGSLPVEVRLTVDNMMTVLLRKINTSNHYSLHFLNYDIIAVYQNTQNHVMYKVAFFVHDSRSNASRCLITHISVVDGITTVHLLKTWNKSPLIEWSTKSVVDFTQEPSSLEYSNVSTDSSVPSEPEEEFVRDTRCGDYPENSIHFKWTPQGLHDAKIIVEDGGYNYACRRRPFTPNKQPNLGVLPRSEAMNTQFDLARGITGFP